MDNNMANAFQQEGYNAFWAKRACPYDEGSTEQELWSTGFNDAAASQKRADEARAARGGAALPQPVNHGCEWDDEVEL